MFVAVNNCWRLERRLRWSNLSCSENLLGFKGFVGWIGNSCLLNQETVSCLLKKKRGFHDDVLLSSALINLYEKGWWGIDKASQVFHETPHQEDFLWNTIIMANLGSERWKNALELFCSMQSASVKATTGLRKKNASLITPFKMTEKLFVDKFLKQFVEDSSYLLNLYEEKLKLAYIQRQREH